MRPRSSFRPSPFAFLLAVAVVVLAAAILTGLQLFRPGSSSSATVKFLIRERQTAREIADTLAARGVIRSPDLFALLARLTGDDRSFKIGRYTLPVAITEYQALRRIAQGGEQNAFVTIPEGFTLAQIAGRLQAEQVCGRSGFLAACRDTGFLHRLGIAEPTAEGYLFPDSYYLPYGAAPEEVVRIMTTRFFSIFNPLRSEWGHDSATRPLRLTTNQVVTLASIIEAEAEQDSERPLIASVFLNRLRRGMRLQSCATVEYILPQRKAILSEEDTRTESPYNTYLHSGLPPGPIGNPGKTSLRAALFPARTGYLFFVAKGGGWHHFSSNYADHLAARRRYRTPG